MRAVVVVLGILFAIVKAAELKAASRSFLKFNSSASALIATFDPRNPGFLSWHSFELVPPEGGSFSGQAVKVSIDRATYTLTCDGRMWDVISTYPEIPVKVKCRLGSPAADGKVRSVSFEVVFSDQSSYSNYWNASPAEVDPTLQAAVCVAYSRKGTCTPASGGFVCSLNSKVYSTTDSCVNACTESYTCENSVWYCERDEANPSVEGCKLAVLNQASNLLLSRGVPTGSWVVYSQTRGSFELSVGPADAGQTLMQGYWCIQDVNLNGELEDSEHALCLQASGGWLCPFGLQACDPVYEQPYCPPPGSLNGQRDVCEAQVQQYICPSGSAYDRVLDLCTAAPQCPSPGSYNPQNDRCEVRLSNSNCPEGFVWNTQLLACTSPPICPGGGVFNPSTDVCQYSASPVCPEGFTYHAGLNVCVKQVVISCPSGYTYNASSGKCEAAPQCPQGTVYNPQTNRCEGMPSWSCPVGSYNPSTGKCESAPIYGSTEDVLNQSFQLQNTSVCTWNEWDCCGGWWYYCWDCSFWVLPGLYSRSKYCRSSYYLCSDGYWGWYDVSEECCRITTGMQSCGIGCREIVGNAHTKGYSASVISVYIPPEVFSALAYVKIGIATNTGGCDLDFDDDTKGRIEVNGTTVLNVGWTNCEPCSIAINVPLWNFVPGWNTVKWVVTGWASDVCNGCRPVLYRFQFNSSYLTCPSGMSYNSSTGKCEGPAQPVCPAGSSYVSGLCTANPTCASGGVLNGTTDKCELVPSYQCPSGSSYDPVSGYCTAVPSWACPSGYSYNSTRRVCERPPCDTGVFDPSRDICVVYAYSLCPQPYSWLSGTDLCTIQASCPSGTQLSSSLDVCTAEPQRVCPSGYTYSKQSRLCEAYPICSYGTYDPAKDKCFTGQYACPYGSSRPCLLLNGVRMCSPYDCWSYSNAPFQPEPETPEGSNDPADDGQWTSDGRCIGTVYLFSGRDMRCRVAGLQTGFFNCCDGGDTWFGLGRCNPTEQMLAKLIKMRVCHEVGTYCSSKILGVCVQKKKTYCCFGSKLGRILHEQGRPQLKSFAGDLWGVPKSPKCRGFTAEEFQMLDFDRIDLSEWFGDIVVRAQQEIASEMQQKVTGYFEQLR